MAKENEKPKVTEERAKSLREKYGIPDWTQEKYYYYINGLPKEQIRWEFLRREDGYRSAWERNKSGSGFGLSKFIDPKLQGDNPLLKNFKLNDTKYRGVPVGMCLQPPNIKKMLSLPYEEQDKYLYQDYGKQLTYLEECGFVVMMFDPRQPISPQLTEAKKHLQKIQKEEEKPESVVKKKKYPPNPEKLLRVLDAHSEGWKFWEIIYKISGDDKLYEGTKKAYDQEADRIGRDLYNTAIYYRTKY